MSDSQIRIEYVPLREMQRWPRNPKKHSDPDIQASIRRFGYVQPIVVDERTGRIVAGHGRLDALSAMRDAGKEPPARIEVVDNDWKAPVLRGVSFKNKHEAEAFLLADNQTTILGGWDDDALVGMLRELEQAQVPIIGWNDEELAKLLGTDAGGELHGDPDDMPDAPSDADVYVQRGDLWQLGEHRLMCGDSTSAEDVALLMGGERAGLMNTDPPYGVAYANDERPNPGVAKPRVANDDLSDAKLQAFLEAAFRIAVDNALLPNAAWYMWHAHLTQGYFAAAAAAAAAANVVLHRQIIWVKPVLLLGRGQYHWKHEPCFMGWVKGHQPPDYGLGAGERTQTTVWEIGSVTQAERREFNHSSPKPVGLFELPIVKHLKAGEIAYEPFSGSGPQIIAAEKTNRRCYAMELEPRYVQVAIERWQKLTGKEARKVEGN